MYDHLMRDFAVSAAVLGNLAACYFYTYALMQLPVGLMVDRFGPRRLLTLAAFVAAAGSLLFGLAASIEIAYGARLLIGIGSGVVFISALKLATIWLPPGRFALVTGLTQAVAMIGAVAGQAPLAALIEAVGRRETMVLGAGLGLVLGLVIWSIAREPDGFRANRAAATAATGLGPALGAVFSNPQT